MTDIRSSSGGGSAISWRTVEVFRNRSMAEVASSALRSAGLQVRVVADDAEGVGLPLGLRFNGAELQVPTGDVDEARDLLEGGLGLDLDADAQAQEWTVAPEDSQRHGGDLADHELDDELDDPPDLDMGVAMAFKVIAVVLLVGVLVAALWSALG